MFGFGLISPVLATFAIFTTTLSETGLTAVNITTYATCDGVVDDTAGWAAFVAANQGGNVVLTIPSGKTCCFLSGGGAELAKGINFLRVLGYGATITNQCNATIGPDYSMGSAGFTDDIAQNGTTSAAIQTASAGASFVTLNTAAETSRFTASRWAILGGLDLQGPGGYPPNFGYHDFVFVTAKDGGCQGTGTVCFRTPIANSYKSNWPDYGQTNPPVGPARLYELGSAWGGSTEWRGVTITSKSSADGLDSEVKTSGLSIKFIDATFTGNVILAGRGTCPFATDGILFEMINVSAQLCELEMDKNVDQIIVNNSTVRRIVFQSASINLATIDSSTIFHLSGTPLRTTLSRSTITSLMQLGASGYGADTSINYLTLGNTIASTEDISLSEVGVDTKSNPWTMSGGVMTRSIANIVSDTGSVYWAVPGHSYNFTGVGCAPCAFTISDIVQSGGNVQITTNLAGGFPGSSLTVSVAPITRN